MKPEGGWYAPLAAFFCAALLGAACLLFVGMLGTAIGPFRFDAMLREGAGAPPLGLWQPPSSQALADRAALGSWRAVLPAGLEVVESAELAELVAVGADPIVVSDARALAAGELDALLSRVRAGGTAVLAGWIAVRDESGRARGSASMARMLDVAGVATLRARWLARGPRGPLASGLEPERRLELPAAIAAPAISVPAELYWADAQGVPAGAVCGALRLLRLGSGSLLWIATPPPSPPADPSWRALYRNALAGALRQPAHELLGSPAGAPLAGAELEAWAAARAAVRSALESITPRRFRLRITNEGTQSAHAIVVRVYLNRPLRGAVAHSSTLFTRDPQLTRGAEHLDLELPSLPEGASRSYVVDVAY